jgi:subtilase family serine protease
MGFILLLFVLGGWVSGSVLSHTPKTRKDFVSKTNRNNPTFSVDVYFEASSRNALFDTFRDVSDPRSARFGRYLSQKEICLLVEPSPLTLKHAGEFFRSLTTSHPFACKDVMRLSGTRKDFESLLNISVGYFQSTIDRSVFVWAVKEENISFPSQLNVKLVHGLHFPVVVTKAKRRTNKKYSSSSSAAIATPAILKVIVCLFIYLF